MGNEPADLDALLAEPAFDALYRCLLRGGPGSKKAVALLDAASAKDAAAAAWVRREAEEARPHFQRLLQQRLGALRAPGNSPVVASTIAGYPPVFAEVLGNEVDRQSRRVQRPAQAAAPVAALAAPAQPVAGLPTAPQPKPTSAATPKQAARRGADCLVDIAELRATDRWVLYLDEAGERFGGGLPAQTAATMPVIAAIACHASIAAAIGVSAGYHAAGHTTRGIEAQLDLLEQNVGVIGARAHTRHPGGDGAQWIEWVLATIALAVRRTCLTG